MGKYSAYRLCEDLINRTICRDNYGFVTFAFKVDAYEAVEHGNDDPSLPKYDLCFGGRRTFCKVRYSDLGRCINSYRAELFRSSDL
jgi:hypothetical protein